MLSPSFTHKSHQSWIKHGYHTCIRCYARLKTFKKHETHLPSLKILQKSDLVQEFQLSSFFLLSFPSSSYFSLFFWKFLVLELEGDENYFIYGQNLLSIFFFFCKTWYMFCQVSIYGEKPPLNLVQAFKHKVQHFYNSLTFF